MAMITKKIKEMPWPEPKCINSRQSFYITVNMPVIDGEQMLLVTLQGNPEFETESNTAYNRNRENKVQNTSLRILISKKQHDFRIIDKKGSVSLGNTQITAMWPHGETPYNMYPEISATDEARIRRFCVTKETRNHQLDNLWQMMIDLREEKKKQQSIARGEILDDEVYDCPTELPEDFMQWVRREILDKDNTLIYKKGNIRGLCFLCKENVRATTFQRFRNHEYATCPNCGKRVVCYIAGGQAWKVDHLGTIALFQRKENGTVFIRIFKVMRDMQAKYEPLSKYLEEISRYAIRGNKTKRWTIEGREREGLSAMSRIITYRLKDWQQEERDYCHPDAIYTGNLDEAAKGTSLQYICLSEYIKDKIGHPIKYALLAARYPVMEFLYKKGYDQILKDRLWYPGQQGMAALNWTKNNLKECFKIPPFWLKVMPPQEWTLDGISRCNLLYESRPKAKESEIIIAAKRDVRAILKYTKYAPLDKIVNYTSRQAEREEVEQYQRNHTKDMEYIYRDYMQECEILKLDLSDETIMFPPSLIRAHERTSSQVKYKQSEAKRVAFAKRVEKLAALSWTCGQFLIRPAENLEELTQEGKTLKHCVAGYADRMANGETAIFFVRKTDEPEQPYYTLELKGKRVVQCRTLRNKSYEAQPEVKAFIDAWIASVVNKPAGKVQEAQENKNKSHKEDAA